MSESSNSIPLLTAVAPETTSTSSKKEPEKSEEMPDLSALNIEEIGQAALAMAVLNAVQTVVSSPGVQSLIEAQAKRISADASLNAAKASTDAELTKMREQLAHERAMDAQKSQWILTSRRDVLAVILLSVWTIVGVGALAAAVYAIHEKVIDSQTAITLGVVLASVLGAATARLMNRPPPVQ